MKHYGMFTENGNRVIDGIVIVAKEQDYAKDEVIIRARIYVTPDSDVKLIRKIQG